MNCRMFYLQMRPGGFQCRLVLLRVKLWILAGRESPEDVHRDLDEEGKRRRNVRKEIGKRVSGHRKVIKGDKTSRSERKEK